jgi:diguanylate cyclase (GGDEF)-like protein/PAS domain S-box-containing protein
MSASDVFRFQLFVAGDAFHSSQAIANLTALCVDHLPDRHEIEIIDVFRHAADARAAQVTATPTLLKLSPLPAVAIVGTLNDTRAVLEALGLGVSMTPLSAGAVVDAATADELDRLASALCQTDTRLDELTGQAIDSVVDAHGHVFLLRHAQTHLRKTEAAKQAAIINALPAHIALLDAQGLIVSVNEGWRRFAGASMLHNPGWGVGLDYLRICDEASASEAPAGHAIGAGIRAVLSGEQKIFSIEYACQSGREQRWFLLTVTPLVLDRPLGAVVMHVDITGRRVSQQNLFDSESRFRQMAETIDDVFFLGDATGTLMIYVSPAYDRIWGLSRESLYADPRSWIQSVHAEDRVDVMRGWMEVGRAGFDQEFRIVRADSRVCWIHLRGYPLLNDDGVAYRIAAVATDITQRKDAAYKLLESERRFSDLLRDVQLASVMLDVQGTITFCNDFFLRLTGWELDQVIGRNWFEHFIPWQHTEGGNAFAFQLSNQRESWQRENQIVTRSGERRRMRWSNSLLRSAEGELIGSASIGEDITEQRAAELKIRHLNRVHAVSSGIGGLIVRVLDRDELFREACRVAVEAGGFRMAWIGMIDAAGTHIVPVASAAMSAEHLQEITERLRQTGGLWLGESTAAQAIREKKPVVANDLQSLAPINLVQRYLSHGIGSLAKFPLIVDGAAVGVLALYADDIDYFHEEEMKLLGEISNEIAFAVDHIGKAQKINYLAYYDNLTGLANRTLFLERVAQYVRSAIEGRHRLAVWLVDLERFKNVNDTLGQAAGDALLRQVALWLTQGAGDIHLVARVGPDLFALVLPVIKESGDLDRLVETRIEKFTAHSFHINDSVLRIAAKVGCSTFPDDGVDATVLLRHAEVALKKAKMRGERYLWFQSQMTEKVSSQLMLESQLRVALERQEFVLHYQPKVDLQRRMLTGAEALIRWKHPRRGLVAPSEFIPVLEETGLIHQVGAWALRTAMKDFLRWRESGLRAVPISVNVSAIQLRKRSFIQEIEQLLSIGINAASGLELEITESVMMSSVMQTVDTLRAVQAMGVKIAIDDFGTGFSSLNYLSRLPVDILKIDQSFVSDMTSGPQGLAVVTTIIALAKSLHLKLVAEGVETEEQAGLLLLHGCDDMQGFLFSRDLPVDLFEKKFLHSHDAAAYLPR